MSTHSGQAEHGRPDEYLINSAAVTVFGYVAFGQFKMFEKGGLEGFAKKLVGQLKDPARILHDLNRFNPGKFVKKPSTTCVQAGLSIIFTKPYKVGEHISLLGVHGDVVMVDIFSTTLVHPDQSRVIIPNRKIVGEILHNFGTIRQNHLTVDVAYKTDLDRALAIVRDVVATHPHVLKDPAPSVGISSLGHSTVTIAIEPWSPVAQFNATQGELNKAILERLRDAQIEFPPLPLFPTR